MSPQSLNHTETLLAALSKALNHLKEPEILKESPLLGLPAVAAKEYCKLQGCVHNYPYDCLAKAIRYLIETRVKNWRNQDQIWRGCLLLELHRIYPSFVNKQVKIEIKHLSGLKEDPQLDLDVASAIDYVEQELLNKQSVWLLFGEFPRERAIFNLLKLARRWLLDQLQNDPTAIILTTRQLFRHQYRNFTILGGETIDFDERSVMPQLKPRGSQNERYILEEILSQHPREGIYVYGPAGAGKTTLYRYAVWLLSRAYLLTAGHTLHQFPIPVDCERFGQFTPVSSPRDLISLASEQWLYDLSELEAGRSGLTSEHWLQLPVLLKGADLRLVVDNLDWLSFNPSSRWWHAILAQGLERYPFIVFSRRQEPPWQYSKTMRIYDLVPFSPAQKAEFISAWTTRQQQAHLSKKWELKLARATTSIQKLAGTPLGLLMVCFQFEQNQALPSSPVALKRTVVETLLAVESKRLLPNDDTAAWQIANILTRLAWYSYVDPVSGIARDRARNLTLSEAQRLFAEDSLAQQLLLELCRSRFLNLVKRDFFREEVIFFTEHLQREFFVARQLTAMGLKAQPLIAQMSDRNDWQEIIMFYHQLLLTEADGE